MLISDIVNELNRELSIRRGVFPRLIKDGRLTEGEAAERIDRLRAAVCVATHLQRIGCQWPDDVLRLQMASPALNTNPKEVLVPISIKGGGQ